MLPRNADVVIIGAGVIGASIAYHLAKDNIQTVVLDKKEIAAGSSSACEGLLLLQSKKPGIHLDMALDSIRRFPALEQELGHPVVRAVDRGDGLVDGLEALGAEQGVPVARRVVEGEARQHAGH